MKDSVTYQAIVEEGKVEGIQNLILQLGRKRFGAPSEEIEAALRATTDVDRLSQLGERLLDVASWDELLVSSARTAAQSEGHHDLDSLAGTWSDEETDAFLSVIAEIDRADQDLWK